MDEERNNNPEIISNLEVLGKKFKEITDKSWANKKFTNKKISNKKDLIKKISEELKSENNNPEFISNLDQFDNKIDKKEILTNLSKHLEENINNLKYKGKLSKRKIKRKRKLKTNLNKLNNNKLNNNNLKKSLINNLKNNIEKFQRVRSKKLNHSAVVYN